MFSSPKRPRSGNNGFPRWLSACLCSKQRGTGLVTIPEPELKPLLRSQETSHLFDLWTLEDPYVFTDQNSPRLKREKINLPENRPVGTALQPNLSFWGDENFCAYAPLQVKHPIPKHFTSQNPHNMTNCKWQLFGLKIFSN